jgi:hypothetical protein
MTSHNVEAPSVLEICAHIKHLGYGASARVRLYGEEFEVLSDPFPEAGGIAVQVKTKKDSNMRVLRLPPVDGSAKRERPRRSCSLTRAGSQATSGAYCFCPPPCFPDFLRSRHGFGCARSSLVGEHPNCREPSSLSIPICPSSSKNRTAPLVLAT